MLVVIICFNGTRFRRFDRHCGSLIDCMAGFAPGDLLANRLVLLNSDEICSI